MNGKGSIIHLGIVAKTFHLVPQHFVPSRHLIVDMNDCFWGHRNEFSAVYKYHPCVFVSI
jgi:hypothetical protein